MRTTAALAPSSSRWFGDSSQSTQGATILVSLAQDGAAFRKKVEDLRRDVREVKRGDKETASSAESHRSEDIASDVSEQSVGHEDDASTAEPRFQYEQGRIRDRERFGRQRLFDEEDDTTVRCSRRSLPATGALIAWCPTSATSLPIVASTLA